MNIIKIILAISVFILAIMGFTNVSMNLTPFMLFFVGALLLTMGLEEIKKEKKTIGYLLIIISLFNFFVSIHNFILN